jgi:2-hydroxychromene-2-carboxylate isomerase
MSTTIEVYYSFQSPYSYLALESLYELEKKHDIELIWQPFSAKASGNPTPATPLLPEKLSYLFEDTKRLAKDANIPIVYPESWPENEYDPGRITRGAVVASDFGVLMEYNYKVFHQVWGLGENPNDENFMNGLCEELDIDLGEFLSRINASDTRERVKGIYKRGKKFNVYDTPTMVIGEERFVGIDKVAYLDKHFTALAKSKN